MPPYGRWRAAASGHEPVGDPALGQVVGRHFDEHFVAGQHADSVLAHLAGGMAEDLVTVLERTRNIALGSSSTTCPASREFFLGQAIPLLSRQKVAEPYKRQAKMEGVAAATAAPPASASAPTTDRYMSPPWLSAGGR
jgi:hypothetical protein